MNEMKNIKMICFDMDGTIADLYGVNGWHEMGSNGDATPYKIAEPLWNMRELAEILQKARARGIEVRVITWLWRNGNADFAERTRQAKLEWLKKYGFPFDHFHGVRYGTTKADTIRRYLANDESAILFDDNAKVRSGWHMGEAVNPQTENILDYLKGILE